MKNVLPCQLKKAIVLADTQFERLLYQLFGVGNVSVYIDAEGLFYSVEGMDFHEVNAQLAKHFGVKKITSIHADDCDNIGIWICYTTN